MDYTKKNIEVIEGWIDEGWEWSVPISKEKFEAAKKGEWDILLTPSRPIPHHWLLPIQGKNVLGLASGGGQQMPILAALGANCTLMDYSQKQLQNDIIFAKEEGYPLRAIQADFTEPFPFEDDEFDVIVCPVSLVYARELFPIYLEMARVLKKGGILLLGMDNGINFITNDEERIENYFPFDPIANKDQEKIMIANDCGYQFSHNLEETIGGLLRVGFRIEDLFDDYNSEGRFKELKIPSYFALKARLERKD